MIHTADRTDGWRAWVHLPWHCPFCILIGTALGFGAAVLLVALVERLWGP
jgi:hypothetical protein